MKTNLNAPSVQSVDDDTADEITTINKQDFLLASSLTNKGHPQDPFNLGPIDASYIVDSITSSRSSSQCDSYIVCIIGCGYVGEMLLREFSTVYYTIGLDISPNRIEALRKEYSSAPSTRKILLTTDKEQIAEATHFLVSVPTLVRPDNTVDTSHLLCAIETMTSHAFPGSTIVIESSVSIGMTRSLLAPYLDTFNCGMSPERVDPGRIVPAPRNIPKIISGLNESSLKSIRDLYEPVFRTLVPVTSPEVAEMTKLYENCFRMINIAYVNEIADACEKQNIDVNEVVNAAGTKPFGFMSFTPGLGVGGQCIPVNPYYLMANNSLPLLEKATRKMTARPRRLARELYRNVAKDLAKKRSMRSRSSSATRARGPWPVKSKPRILVVGVGFKEGQSSVSFSPALQFAKEIAKLGCSDLAFYDPLVSQKDVPWMRKVKDGQFKLQAVERKFDAVAVCVKQAGVNAGIVQKVKEGRRVLVREW